MNKRSRMMLRYAESAALVCVAFAVGGCQLFVNPWNDELACRPAVTTPSVELARAAAANPHTAQRDVEPALLPSADGSVTHGPLYFEDPFEDKGSVDGRFAWTVEDYFAFVYDGGRFLLNGMAVPVSMIVTPPWTVMVSDGKVSRQLVWRDHDATRWPEAGSKCCAR